MLSRIMLIAQQRLIFCNRYTISKKNLGPTAPRIVILYVRVCYNKDPASSRNFTFNSGTPAILPSNFRRFPQNSEILLVRDLNGPDFGVSLYIPYRLKVFRLYMLPVKSFTGYNCFLKRDFAKKISKIRLFFMYFSQTFRVFS